MKWTNKQQRIIDLENSNILVSAAAGSGKTAVMVERIIRLIKKGNDIDKFLVERYLAQYLALNIDSKFEFYLFLCDEVWNTVSKMIIYKGLWKQKQNKCNFGKYNSSKEYYLLQ